MTERKQKITAAAATLVYLLAVTAFALRPVLALGLRRSFYHLPLCSKPAHGQGLVYNLGERVSSTTTPLPALLLAALLSEV